MKCKQWKNLMVITPFLVLFYSALWYSLTCAYSGDLQLGKGWCVATYGTYSVLSLLRLSTRTGFFITALMNDVSRCTSTWVLIATLFELCFGVIYCTEFIQQIQLTAFMTVCLNSTLGLDLFWFCVIFYQAVRRVGNSTPLQKTVSTLQKHPYLRLIRPSDETWTFINRLIQDTWLYDFQRGRDAEKRKPYTVEVKQVFRINNALLLHHYRDHGAEQRTPADDVSLRSTILTVRLQNTPAFMERIHDRNKDWEFKQPLGDDEAFLFHGSTIENILDIVEIGFDKKNAVRTAFWHGTHLAESSQKADQYAGGPDEMTETDRRMETLGMLVVRTRLGDIKKYYRDYTDEAEEEDEDLFGDTEVVATNKLRFREFVVKDEKNLYPDYAKWLQMVSFNKLHFREFVVKDEKKLYPEYVVLYDRVKNDETSL